MTVPPALLQIQESPTLFVMETDASTADNDATYAWAKAGLTVRSLRGSKMRTSESMFDEVAAAWQFPWYFGENWAALDDCLCDMDWLLPATGFVVLIRDAVEVLADEKPSELRVLIQVLETASSEYGSPIELGEWWDRPPVGFHVVLHTPPKFTDKLIRRWESAGASTTPLLS